MTVKDLEDEYALYTIEDEETYTEEEIREYAEYLYECLEDDRESLSEDLKANKKFVIKTRIMDFFNGYDSGIINIINEDNELLRTEWSLLTMFQGYFRTLYEVLHSESINEGYRLICYCAKNYQDNMDYIEDIRNDLDASMYGYSSRRFDGRYTMDVFPEFLDKEFSRLIAIKPVEKRKEMWYNQECL